MNRTQTWIVTAAVAVGAAVGAAGIAAAANGSTSTSNSGTSNSGISNSGYASDSAASQAGSTAPDPAAAGHGPGETLLTGTTAEKVRAAAAAAVPGGTIIRVETDSAGSPYEAHARKSDGTEVTLKIDANFKVTATESGFGRGPAGDGHR